MLCKSAVEPGTLELLETICQLPEFNSFALGGGTKKEVKTDYQPFFIFMKSPAFKRHTT